VILPAAESILTEICILVEAIEETIEVEAAAVV